MSAPKGNKNAVGNRGGPGAPPIYDPIKHVRAAALACKAGFTRQQFADMIAVSLSTVDVWIQKHLEFSTALKTGRLTADATVAMSLYERATGYEHAAVKIFLVDEVIIETDSNGNEVKTLTKKEMYVPYTERYPPDTGAAIFWLKNRQPDKWRDRPIEQEGGETHYHLHMEMPAPVKLVEGDRSYREPPLRPTIEHEPSS